MNDVLNSLLLMKTRKTKFLKNVASKKPFRITQKNNKLTKTSNY